MIAHRGASRAEPENTVAAFLAARAIGADWVELDVRLTADGALAVHHDALLSGGAAIADVVRDELPASVPLLDEALVACAGMGVNVEIKNQPGEAGFDPEVAIASCVAAVLARRDAWQPVLVSSFHAPTLARLRAIDSTVATALLTFNLPDRTATVAACVSAGHGALHPFVGTVDRALVDACHDAGLEINVWTVDDPDQIAELVDLGVDGIVTNVPDVARLVVDRRD